jgi:6-phosphogluconolactonase
MWLMGRRDRCSRRRIPPRHAEGPCPAVAGAQDARLRAGDTASCNVPGMRGVYIGSYTGEAGGEGVGITLARQDEGSGELQLVGVVARTPAPSYLAWHPDGRILYAVNEVEPGTVSAFAVEPDGRLRSIGSQPTGGTGPCHLMVHPGGRYLLAANYVSGDVSVHPVAGDGSLGPRTELVRHSGRGPRDDRQEAPHAHQVRVTPDGRYVLATDLGTDSVHTYRLDPDSGTLQPASQGRTEPGAGPRHLVFGAGGSVHVACELDSTVSTFRYEPETGTLTLVHIAPSIVDAGAENYPSEVAIDAAGRFVYVANRGRDVVTTLAVAGDGLRPVADVPAGGRWPRHLALIGSHLYVANQLSHQVTAFRLDPVTGVPQPTGALLEVPSPACILPA